MARVPYLQQSDLPPEHQELLARPIALNRAMANNPEASKAMSGLAMYIRNKMKLDPRLRELAILQVGYLAKQAYEYSHHVKIGREFGVTDDDIRAIGEETAGRPTKLDALPSGAARRARDDQRPRHVGRDLRRARKGARTQPGDRSRAGDRVLQRRGPACSARCRSTSSRSISNISKSIRCRGRA